MTDEPEEKSSRWPVIAVIGAMVVLIVTLVVGVELSSTGGTASEDCAAATTVAGTTASIDISGYAYCPANLTVDKGAVVTFLNDDKVQHTATEKATGAWDTQVIHEGGSTAVQFSIPGTYQYYCTIHPYMTGTLTVR